LKYHAALCALRTPSGHAKHPHLIHLKLTEWAPSLKPLVWTTNQPSPISGAKSIVVSRVRCRRTPTSQLVDLRGIGSQAPPLDPHLLFSWRSDLPYYLLHQKWMYQPCSMVLDHGTLLLRTHHYQDRSVIMGVNAGRTHQPIEITPSGTHFPMDWHPRIRSVLLPHHRSQLHISLHSRRIEL
jgi:hypothetical protein